jgi:hypothetical protein
MNDPRSRQHDPLPEPLLEALLAEAVGGATPPDVAQRVLARLEAQRGAVAGENTVPDAGFVLAEGPGAGLLGAAGDAECVAVPASDAALPGTGAWDRHQVNGTLEGARAAAWSSAGAPGANARQGAASRVAGRRAARARFHRRLALVSVAAGIVVVLGGYYVLRHWDAPASPAGGPAVAGNPSGDNSAPPPSPAAGGSQGRGASAGSGTPSSGAPQPTPQPPGRTVDLAQRPIEAPPPSIPPGQRLHAYPRWDHVPPRSNSREEIIATIDELLRRRWNEAGIFPAPPASDAEWCRRVYVDVLGRIPTVEELLQFVNDRSLDKKARLVDRLLNSEAYVEEFAHNWTGVWMALLVGRRSEADRAQRFSRAGLEQYLRQSLLRGKPYDAMVRELLTATGSGHPGTDDYNGAANFLLAHADDKWVTATARVSTLFLGTQLHCTQCHVHPFDAEAVQSQFWQLNAFFRQATVQSGRRGQPPRLEDRDFAGESNDPDRADIYFEQRNGLLRVAYPVFLDGTKINPSGRLEVVHRRRELARLVTQSDRFRQAAVNRVWAHFLGFGFTRPVDDFGSHNPPSHPELLELLGRQFAAAGYDLRELIRWITLSQAYGLSSQVPLSSLALAPSGGDNPHTGTQPLFSYFYARPMRPEEVYESLLVVSGTHARPASVDERQRAKDAWVQQFALAYGTDENDETSLFNGGVQQSLAMLNGELVRRATSRGEGSLLGRVAGNSQMNFLQKISYLYLAALGREPDAKELRAVQKTLQAHRGDAGAALEDVFWALLNSSEFILQH